MALRRAAVGVGPLAVLLVGLLATPRTHGFVLFPADGLNSSAPSIKSITEYLYYDRQDGRPPLFRWSAATDLRDEYGLGGGITYAFDPSFCAEMLDRFEEAQGAIKLYDFVTCDTIQDSVRSALSTWESNNRNIYFTDVSNICDNEDLWKEVPKDACTSTTCRTCPLAEVVINIFQSTPEDHSGARVQPKAIANSPRGTNGVTAPGGSLQYVELQYGDNLCWYIDATFCSLFHNMEANGLPVVAIVGVVLGTAFLVAAFVAVYMLYRLLKVFLYTMLSTWDTDKDGDVDLDEVADAVEAAFKSLRNLVKYGSFGGTGGRTIELDDALFAVLDVFANQLKIVHLTLMLFGLIFPALVLNDVFLPCWNCYDFEAASVHEVGHILGFDHPDQYPGLNFVSDRSQYNCSDPTQGVSMDSAYEANSVMQAFLPRNPKTCLTDDDLDGLNFLYPVCSDSIQQEPVCIKPNQNIGWPRLLQSIVAAEFIPLLIILALKILCKFILATKEEFQERQIRSNNVKSMQDAKVKTARLEEARKRKEDLANGERAPSRIGSMLNMRAKQAQVEPSAEPEAGEAGSANGREGAAAAVQPSEGDGGEIRAAPPPQSSPSQTQQRRSQPPL